MKADDAKRLRDAGARERRPAEADRRRQGTSVAIIDPRSRPDRPAGNWCRFSVTASSYVEPGLRRCRTAFVESFGTAGMRDEFTGQHRSIRQRRLPSAQAAAIDATGGGSTTRSASRVASLGWLAPAGYRRALGDLAARTLDSHKRWNREAGTTVSSTRLVKKDLRVRR